MDFALGDTSNLTSVQLKRIKKAVSHAQCVEVPFLPLKSKIVIDNFTIQCTIFNFLS